MTASIIRPGQVFADASDFDPGIRTLLPQYDDMLDAIVRCLPSNISHVLDLGCGTGELTLKILQAYPTAHVTAVDYAASMLAKAQAKIAAQGFAEQATWIELDFGQWAEHPTALNLTQPLDVCVSSLAIHHLTDAMKLKLFSRIREQLSPQGCFWNADPVLPQDDRVRAIYQLARDAWAEEQGTTLAAVRAKTGTSQAHGHSSQDQLAPLMDQLAMLGQAGFAVVDVVWKYYGLAVFGGYTELNAA
ncbi:MAG: class I SAM-dependent methyltransferase [Cyanobacteria bacterium P01_H01_bin.121]